MREQLSFFPVLLQVSVAFGATSPGGHLTSSGRDDKALMRPRTHILDLSKNMATCVKVSVLKLKVK